VVVMPAVIIIISVVVVMIVVVVIVLVIIIIIITVVVVVIIIVIVIISVVVMTVVVVIVIVIVVIVVVTLVIIITIVVVVMAMVVATIVVMVVPVTCWLRSFVVEDLVDQCLDEMRAKAGILFVAADFVEKSRVGSRHRLNEFQMLLRPSRVVWEKNKYILFSFELFRLKLSVVYAAKESRVATNAHWKKKVHNPNKLSKMLKVSSLFSIWSLLVTLSITTFSIMTLSIKGLFVTFSIKNTLYRVSLC